MNKDDWVFTELFEGKSKCANCGKPNIKNIYVVTNNKTGNLAHVGNECIKLFGALPKTTADALVVTLKQKTNYETIPQVLIEKAKEENVINDWEYNFLSDMHNRRKILSEKQKNKKALLNGMIKRKFIQTRGIQND